MTIIRCKLSEKQNVFTEEEKARAQHIRPLFFTKNKPKKYMEERKEYFQSLGFTLFDVSENDILGMIAVQDKKKFQKVCPILLNEIANAKLDEEARRFIFDAMSGYQWVFASPQFIKCLQVHTIPKKEYDAKEKIWEKHHRITVYYSQCREDTFFEVEQDKPLSETLSWSRATARQSLDREIIKEYPMAEIQMRGFYMTELCRYLDISHHTLLDKIEPEFESIFQKPFFAKQMKGNMEMRVYTYDDVLKLLQHSQQGPGRPIQHLSKYGYYKLTRIIQDVQGTELMRVQFSQMAKREEVQSFKILGNRLFEYETTVETIKERFLKRLEKVSVFPDNIHEYISAMDLVNEFRNYDIESNENNRFRYIQNHFHPYFKEMIQDKYYNNQNALYYKKKDAFKFIKDNYGYYENGRLVKKVKLPTKSLDTLPPLLNVNSIKKILKEQKDLVVTNEQITHRVQKGEIPCIYIPFRKTHKGKDEYLFFEEASIPVLEEKIQKRS